METPQQPARKYIVYWFGEWGVGKQLAFNNLTWAKRHAYNMEQDGYVTRIINAAP